MMNIEELISRITRPVSPEFPFGSEIPRDSADFQFIRDQIIMVTPGEKKVAVVSETFWDDLIGKCVLLLETVSKDIRIYCYLLVR
jgi:hypothetical protein